MPLNHGNVATSDAGAAFQRQNCSFDVVGHQTSTPRAHISLLIMPVLWCETMQHIYVIVPAKENQIIRGR